MIYLVENQLIPEKTSVALGIFDGVHLGHREILNAAKKCSAEKIRFAVFTFSVSSITNKHNLPYKYIYSEKQKKNILEAMGADYVYSPNASGLMGMDGEEFAKRILKEKMNAQTVVCGENFRFGKNAACGICELLEFGRKYDFSVKVCKLVESEGKRISSAGIKELLKNGDIKTVNKLLGDNYFIEGEVINGNHIGRTINFPTINQLFEQGQVIPERGVYSSQCRIEGRKYYSVTNIGVKPTVAHNINPLAETHILDYHGDLYGKNIKTELTGFIRKERKFLSIEQLKKQIASDVNRVRNINI